jgi:linker histone H1 and H5 family
MATLTLVKQAILSLKERTGSSVPAINKYLEQNEKVSHAFGFRFFLRMIRAPTLSMDQTKSYSM